MISIVHIGHYEAVPEMVDIKKARVNTLACKFDGAPNENRTRVSALKGPRPDL